METCSICGEDYDGWGNNAWPINNGRCCDRCNDTVVLPRRIVDFIKKERKKCQIEAQPDAPSA